MISCGYWIILGSILIFFKLSPINYLQTVWDTIHLMHYKYWDSLLLYYNRNGHMDITKPTFVSDNTVAEEMTLRETITQCINIKYRNPSDNS